MNKITKKKIKRITSDQQIHTVWTNLKIKLNTFLATKSNWFQNIEMQGEKKKWKPKEQLGIKEEKKVKM